MSPLPPKVLAFWLTVFMYLFLFLSIYLFLSYNFSVLKISSVKIREPWEWELTSVTLIQGLFLQIEAKETKGGLEYFKVESWFVALHSTFSENPSIQTNIILLWNGDPVILLRQQPSEIKKRVKILMFPKGTKFAKQGNHQTLIV